jgi:hypothetical protein
VSGERRELEEWRVGIDQCGYATSNESAIEKYRAGIGSVLSREHLPTG